jgi:hypothetical protein
MNVLHQRRTWFWIAIAAIVVALIAFLVPHGHGTVQPDWLAMLPVFFVGLIAPLSQLPLLPVLSLGQSPNAPGLASSFQRPPPPRA